MDTNDNNLAARIQSFLSNIGNVTVEICEQVREELASSGKFSYGPQSHIAATEFGSYVRIDIWMWVVLEDEDKLVWGLEVDRQGEDWLLGASVARMRYGEPDNMLQSSEEIVSTFQEVECWTPVLLKQLSDDVRVLLRGEPSQ
jgi:hypothetical protein